MKKMNYRSCICAFGLALAMMPACLKPVYAVASEVSLTVAVDLPPTKAVPVPWGRDPFVPLISDVTAPDMALTAIFYNQKRPSAIINGMIVYEGSSVNGQKVIDIKKTHVILHGVSGRIRIALAGLPGLTDGKKKR